MYGEKEILKVLMSTAYRIVDGTSSEYFNMVKQDKRVLVKEFIPVLTSYIVKKYKEIEGKDKLEVIPGSWLAYSALEAAKQDTSDIDEGYPYVDPKVLEKLTNSFSNELEMIKKINDVVSDTYRYLKELPSKTVESEPVFNVMEIVLLDPDTGFITSDSVKSILQPYNVPDVSLDHVKISLPKLTRDDISDLDLGFPDVKIALDTYMEDYPLEYEYSVEDVIRMLDWDNLSYVNLTAYYLDAYVLACLVIKKLLLSKEKEMDSDTVLGLQVLFNQLLKKVKLYTKRNNGKIMIVSMKDDALDEYDTLLYTSDLAKLKELLKDGVKKVLNGYTLRKLDSSKGKSVISFTTAEALVSEASELANLYDNFIKNYNFKLASDVRKELIGKYMLAIDKFFEMLKERYNIEDETALKNGLNVAYADYVKYRDDIFDMDKALLDMIAGGLYAGNTNICHRHRCIASGKYFIFTHMFNEVKEIIGESEIGNLLLSTYTKYVLYTLFRLGVR